jgi:plasmid maintenance system killer protein
LELVYASKKVEEWCTSLKKAKRLFGGDVKLAEKLLSRVNALAQAPTLKDIVVQPQFHFHKLLNKSGKNLEGCFAIDVKSRRDPWRLILRPLDVSKEPIESHSIDEIADSVEIVGIEEVSRHYE